MNKHALKSLFEELSKEYLRSGSAGDQPGVMLEEIWRALKEIKKDFDKIPEK